MLWVVLVLSLLCAVTYGVPHDKRPGTLRLVFKVSRHGERTPVLPTWPTDPYNNIDLYYPFKNGSLTNYGIERQYETGLYLRKRYNEFLGNVYYDGLLKAQATEFSRCINSLLSNLAGLFPPKSINVWSKKYSLSKAWQPIALTILPVRNDQIIGGDKCFNYIKKYEEFTKTDLHKALNDPYSALFAKLENYTGIVPVTVGKVRIPLYANLQAEQQYGFKLPSWTNGVYPKKLIAPLADSYYAMMATPELRKIVIGGFFKELTDEIQMKIDGTLDPGRKIYLYNAHEFTVATILIALGVYDEMPPDFSCFILMELHEIHGEFYLKFFYQNYYKKEPVLLNVPACGGPLCHYNTVYDLVKDIFPGPEDTCTIPE